MHPVLNGLDGRHPWRDVCPDGYVDYRARAKPGGRVLYFNYALAAELGIVSPNHPRKISAELEKDLLDTFGIQILNEYDVSRGRDKRIPPEQLRPHPYMATRYLQSQHRDRRGLNSGDGRAVWNGQIKTPTITFDVSSRGTG